MGNLRRVRSASARVVTSAGLPAGFYFIIIGTLEYTGDTISGLIAVVISFLLLDTRIQISNWKHVITCKLCKNECKVYID
jgi:hypothetical protein